MSLRDRQNQVDSLMKEWNSGYWKPHEILCRLTEETGELAREVNHLFGPKKKKDSEELRELGDEISDIIFTLICMANSLDINLDEAFDKMMEKYVTRDKNRHVEMNKNKEE